MPRRSVNLGRCESETNSDAGLNAGIFCYLIFLLPGVLRSDRGMIGHAAFVVAQRHVHEDTA